MPLDLGAYHLVDNRLRQVAGEFVVRLLHSSIIKVLDSGLEKIEDVAFALNKIRTAFIPTYDKEYYTMPVVYRIWLTLSAMRKRMMAAAVFDCDRKDCVTL